MSRELRQTANSIKVVGYLKEKDLEEKDATIKVKKNGVEKEVDTRAIGGTVTISANGKDIKVRLYQKKLKKDGNENSIYSGYETIMKEYVSELDVLKKYEGQDLPDSWKSEVTVVGINGEVRENSFVVNGNLIVDTQVNTTFVNRVKSEFVEKAEFSLEGYFSKIKEEMVNDESTGRLLIELIVTAYGGRVFPVQLVAPEGDIADYLESNYEVGMTGKVWGDLDFINTREEKVTKAGFGKDKVEVIIKTKKEMIITGGLEEQYDEDDDKSLDKGLIKQAMNERKMFHDELIERDKKKGNKGGTKPSGRKADPEKDDDIPF